MKSNRKRQQELRERRAKRNAKREREVRTQRETAIRSSTTPGAVPVNVDSLAPNTSYGVPIFVERGYYLDVPFTCGDCGKEEVWTATQQKWWYEVAKGYVYSGATRCRTCRRGERERRAEARRVHLEGVEAKAERSNAKRRQSSERTRTSKS
jgi:hypothetical protein